MGGTKDNISGGCGGGDNVDQNLTGFIEADVNLYQTWWALLLIVLGGAFSAGIGAAAVYYTTNRALKHERILLEEKERQEKDKMLREERKKAYITLIANTMLLSLGPEIVDKMDIIKHMESIATISLIGSPRIISEFNTAKYQDFVDKKDAKSITKLLLPLMAEELQGEDVYEIVEILLKTYGNLGNAADSSEEK